MLQETSQLLAWFRLLYLNETCEQWQVFFLALTDRLKQDDFDQACRRLSVPGRMIAKVFGHRQRVQAILDTLHRRLKHDTVIKNSEIYDLFHGLPLEILLYLAARTEHEQVRRYISLYMTRLRSMRCELDGNALQQLGLKKGPMFGKIIEQLLEARLDGEVNSMAEEQKLAEELISQQTTNAVAQ